LRDQEFVSLSGGNSWDASWNQSFEPSRNPKQRKAVDRDMRSVTALNEYGQRDEDSDNYYWTDEIAAVAPGCAPARSWEIDRCVLQSQLSGAIR